MHRVFVVVISLIMGCGERGKPTDALGTIRDATSSGNNPKSTPTGQGDHRLTPVPKPDTAPIPVDKSQPAVLDEPLAFDGHGNTLIGEYHKNQIAADAKCLNKPVRVTVRVERIGRLRSGTAYIGFTNIGTLREPEPNGLLLFGKSEESAVATAKKGQNLTVTGICKGRFDDGINRGLQGFEWHLIIDQCRVVPDVK